MEGSEVDVTGDVAVLLNAQAKGVTPNVVNSISRRIPPESIFVSSNLDEAQKITRKIMSRGYTRVLTGGGDGTLVNFVNNSFHYAHQNGHENSIPLIGVLKLGTGNGISSYVGAEQYLADLRRMTRNDPSKKQRLSLIEVENKYSHFAGFGLDAAILNDYAGVKNTWLGKRLKYAASVPAVSLPRQLTTRRKYQVGRIINQGRPAYLIGPDGCPLGAPIEKGQTIYHGPILIAGVATIPYYGYGLKLYPFTEGRSGVMQLRVSWASTFETLSNLPNLWRGTYRSKNIRDYYVDKVRIVFEKDAPFQIGGDGVGCRREATFALSKRTIDLIDLTKPRNGFWQ